jgi:outer membrane protein insertion porin family
MRKLWLDLQQYFPTWRRQVVAVGLHGAAAWGNNIPPTELFFLGGANTLRGYDEDWFFGPRRVYANIEYRLLTGRNSQFFAFVDLGAVTKVDAPSVFDPLRAGYGFGLKLESKSGLLRLNYGLAEGSSVLEGKIHVNLGAAF